jgi:GT2 family glycosyltransferase
MSEIAHTNPLVTVNILSFNRKDDLRVTLTKVFEQDYKNIEVIVVDNASSDETVEMVKSEFPTVQLIKMEKNIGIAGWNEGFKAALGELVLVLDDDSYPEKDTISKCVELLNTTQDCGIVACHVHNTRTGKYQTDHLITGPVITFVGCGAMLRTKIIREVGMFEPLLYIYAHEDEYSMRIIDAGYRIHFLTSALIHHQSVLSHRAIGQNSIDKRKLFYSVRNTIIILLLHFPFHRIFLRLIRIILGRLYYGFKNHYVYTVARSILSVLKILREIIARRQLLNKNTLKMYKYGGYAGGFNFSDAVLKESLTSTKEIQQ